MDQCGICFKTATQLFETDKEGVYACFKCQPLVPEVTIQDNSEQPESILPEPQIMVEIVPQEEEKNEEIVAEIVDGLFCGICQKSFQKNGQLLAHMRNHRAERRFVCTYCNKAFSQSNNLRAHLRIHTNERPYKCSECGKAFTQVTNLNNHVRLHTGERPFVCPEPGCTKAYAQVTNLNQHRKRHLQGRITDAEYTCSLCGEFFSQRNHLHTHRREAHGEVRAPPRRVSCKLCDLAFPTERALQKHVEGHFADTTTSTTNTSAANTSASDDDNTESELRCVFKSCGARLGSAREHTEHLLSAHQLRVLSAPPADDRPPRRGRPPKTKPDQVIEQDPLEIEEPKFQPIRIANGGLMSTLKLRGMFQ